MSRRAAVAALALGLGAAPAVAQRGPNQVVSVAGGLSDGGALWELPRRDLPAPGGATDSFALARRLRRGAVATLGVTVFRPDRGLGWAFEIGYFSLPGAGGCRPLGPLAPDPDQVHAQACDAVDRQQGGGHVVALQAGAAARLVSAGPLTPYARALAGFGLLSGSFVRSEATVLSSACPLGACRYALLTEEGQRSLSPVASLAAGVTVRTAPDQQLRLEVRDLLLVLPRVTGAEPLTSPRFPQARTGARLRHLLTLTAGLDIALERRRSRRY